MLLNLLSTIKDWLPEYGKSNKQSFSEASKSIIMILPIRILPYLILSGTLLFLFINALPQKDSLRKDNMVYLLDTTQSKVNWRNYHHGHVKFKEGFIETYQGAITHASFKVDMNRIQDLDIENKLLNGTLNNVLKSADFFNVSLFPTATFELHQIEEISVNHYKISGDFIIFGDGVCYDFTGKITLENNRIYLDTDYFTIDRTDWGIYYLSARNPSPKDEEESYVVGDSIRIDVHIVAQKK